MKKAVKEYKKTDRLLEDKQQTLLHFLKKLKKGSKKIQMVLELDSINQSQPENLRTVETFARITNTAVPNVGYLKKPWPCGTFFVSQMT